MTWTFKTVYVSLNKIWNECIERTFCSPRIDVSENTQLSFISELLLFIFTWLKNYFFTKCISLALTSHLLKELHLHKGERPQQYTFDRTYVLRLFVCIHHFYVRHVSKQKLPQVNVPHQRILFPCINSCSSRQQTTICLYKCLYSRLKLFTRRAYGAPSRKVNTGKGHEPLNAILLAMIHWVIWWRCERYLISH